MLNHYISQCQKIMQLKSTNPLQDLTKELAQSYNDENFSKLIAHFHRPMQIAIVGQFSSGKSSFLNAILGQSVLPTGITPITAKVCKICYKKEYALEILYKDGHQSLHAINYLKTMPKDALRDIESFCLYAPLALLESMNFLDTPGFNSQNQEDTNTTLQILKEVDAIIWLTLIDNAGKHSEKQLLEQYLSPYAQKTLCILNQKDRLKSNEEVQATLEHVQKTFGNLFLRIIPISAKQALEAKTQDTQAQILQELSKSILALQNKPSILSNLEALFAQSIQKIRQINSQAHPNTKLFEDSNLQAILDFLQNQIKPKAAISKQLWIANQLQSHLLSYRKKEHQTLKACKSLLHVFSHFLAQSKQALNQSQATQQQQLNQLYFSLDSQLSTLALTIHNALKTIPFCFVTKQKGLFGSKQITQEKKVITLPQDELKSLLHNQDGMMLKNFKSLSFEIKNFHLHFQNTIQSQLIELNKALQQWQQQHKTFNKEHPTLLLTLTQQIQSHFQKSHAFFQNELHFLSHLLLLNYKNAIELSLTKLHSQIQNALAKHQQDPMQFPLFYPTLDNIRQYLNESFLFETYQASIFEPLNLLKKAYLYASKDQESIKESIKEEISQIQTQALNALQMLKTQNNNIKTLKKNVELQLLSQKHPNPTNKNPLKKDI